MAKNPFPGMNPYLERHWGDVHASLVLYARNQLNRQITGPLRARVEERLVVEMIEEDKSRPIYPDVRVYEAKNPPAEDEPGGGVAVATAVKTAAEPDILKLAEPEPETTTYLRIIDPSTGGALVTVIEFLSPANKRPRGTLSSAQYLGKREELKLGGVSLLEIDLLRSGERFFPEYDDRFAKCLRADYAACVHRGWKQKEYEVYSFALRARLPVIRVPLRKQDPDAWLDLQLLVDQVYEDGKYDDIDYVMPLDPPLTGDDAKWAASLVMTGQKKE
jgi:hypothetical protein